MDAGTRFSSSMYIWTGTPFLVSSCELAILDIIPRRCPNGESMKSKHGSGDKCSDCELPKETSMFVTDLFGCQCLCGTNVDKLLICK